MRRIIVFLVLAILGWNVKAQSIADTSLMLNMFSFHLSSHLPGGDLADRYGMNIGAGGSYMLKFKSNWMLSADFSFFSGNKFKEEEKVFGNITDDDGVFINIYGEIGEVLFYERGFYTGIKGGKLFPVIGPNPNSGILITASAGLLQHKLLIHQDAEDIPSINGDYTKGYDMLTNGIGISQFIGYFHLDSREPINFYVGLEFHQAWTQSRRDYDFYLMGPDEKLRMDYLFGIRFGWIFPINKRASTIHYYY